MPVKVSSSGAVVWGKVYDRFSSYFMVEVDPSETHLFLTSYINTAYPLHKVATSDGSVVDSKRILNVFSQTYTAYLRFFDTTSILHLSGYDASSNAVM